MDTRSRNSGRWILQRHTVLALAALSVSALGAASVRAQDAPANGAANGTANGAAGAPVAAAVAPAAGEAIRLRSVWKPGEMLSYEMRLDGTMNMQASPNATGNPLAGVPLDVEIKASTLAALEALSVDEMGTARVVPRINALRMQATTFGQRADLTLQDGRLAFSFNGQVMGRANRNDRNGAFLSDPPFALEISDRGRITGAVARDDKGRAQQPDGTDANADPKAGAAQATPGLDWAKLAQSMLWRAIPTLWPTMPVKAGDTWKSEISIPLPDPATLDAATPTLVPQQLGRFDFVLRGMEEIAGKKVARIGIKGGLELDNKLSRGIAAVAKSEGAKVAPEAARRAEAAAKAADARRKGDFDTQLSKATQKIEGDLWVDPATGHIVRAELSLDTQTSATEVPRPGFTPRAKPGDSFFDFTGTLQMQLKDRTIKPAA